MNAEPSLTHRQIWQAIDMLALRSGLSASGLARAAGLDPTTFNRSKRLAANGKQRWPSTESLSKALEAAGTSMEEFVGFLRSGGNLADPAQGELANDLGSDLAGVLRLLAPPVLATHVLAPLVSGFRQAYPKILLDIDVESHREPPVQDYDITLMGTQASFDANVIARKVLSSATVRLAAPDYLRRRGTPARPEDLAQHDCLRFKPPGGRTRGWRLLHEHETERFVDIEVQPVLWANHTDTLMHAALDGAGITATTIELAAPLIQNGDLVRVLNPWITDRLTMYAALPSRKFMPRRTEVFLDYLITQTRTRVNSALATCSSC